jgi:hypothetical protein
MGYSNVGLPHSNYVYPGTASPIFFKAQNTEAVEEAEITANENGEVIENTAEAEIDPVQYIIMATVLVMMLSAVTACYCFKNGNQKKTEEAETTADVNAY